MTPLPPLPRPVWKLARTDASFEHWTRGSIATRRRAPSRSALPLCRRQSSLAAAPIVIDAQPDPIDNALARLRALFSSDNDRGNENGEEWARKRKEEVDRSLEANKEALRSPIKYASTRKQRTYLAPRLPCVFLHGLFGFSTLSPIASLPQFSFDYWRGIVERLQQGGVEVLVTNVKTSASIEERAKDALRMIEEKFPGREVNLLGHSMGGLDARYLTSCLKGQRSFKVRSVTTIATPHRGSPFASYLLYDLIGRERLPLLLNAVQGLGIPGGGEAFENLTTEEMAKFNQRVKDEDNVMYTSWGAAFKPGLLNEFRFPHGIIWEKEGHNDGLVSVESSKWGEYRGTLKGTHIDLIGWGNAIQAQWANLTGSDPPFDSQAFYLTVCEDLAKAGL